ncbi:MAG: AAA family ATPase [Bacteroidetes bacterium]|nr:AAA family ATPase [Bacteroidota bacterium]
MDSDPATADQHLWPEDNPDHYFTHTHGSIQAARHIYHTQNNFMKMEHYDAMPGGERPAPFVPQKLLDDLEQCSREAQQLEHEVTAPDLLGESEEDMQFLIEGLLHSQGLACLAGSSDTGKSAILRQLAEDICAGSGHFLHYPIHAQHRSVVYVSTEDSRDATRTVLRRQTRRYGDQKLHGLRFIFHYEDLLTTLRRNLSVKPADLVIIDCFSDLYPHDLKDTHKIREFLKPYYLLANELKCLILFLHHTGKRTEELLPSKNNFLGGQGFEAKMRLGIELRRDHHRPHHRHLCLVKGNYLPDLDKTHSHVLAFCPDTLTFTVTGERVDFTQLSRGYEQEESRAKWEQAKELHNSGKKYDEIAEMLGYAHRSAVAKLFEKAKKNGWDNPQPESEE